MPKTPKEPNAPPKRPRRRWRRRGLLALALILMVLLGVGIVATRTPLVGNTVLAEMSARLGADASAERVRLTLGGNLIAEGFELRLRGIDDPRAARLVTVERAVIDIDFSRLFSPQLPAERVELSGLNIRLSLDARYRLNATDLTLPPPTGYLPAVVVNSAVVEIGEHDEDGYRALERIAARGSLTPDAQRSSTYNLTLEQTDAIAPARERLMIDGTLDVDTRQTMLTLTGLDFADWSRTTAPHGVREIWERMDVTGRVDRATLAITPERGIEAGVAFERVDLNIPIDLGASDIPMNLPGDDGVLTMRGVSGNLTFTRDGLAADLRGSLERLDASLDLDFRGYGEDAPFQAVIDIDSFPVRDRDRLIAIAPGAVDRVYQRFGEPTGELSGTIDLARDTTGGPIDTSGVIFVNNANLRFEDLPYPVQNVQGRVEFNARRVEILDFSGNGPTGASLTASGFIAPPGDGAEVRVDVAVRDMPSDRFLVESLPPGPREAYQTLLNEPALDRLVERGLLTREPGDDTPNAPPVFNLGGTSDIDISVRRALGPESEYETFVNIRIPEARALVEAFPYPAIGRNASIDIMPGEVRVDIPTIAGITGGTGSVTGTVALLGPDGLDVRPDLTVEVANAPIDRFLLHALPGDAGDSNSVEAILAAYRPEGETDVLATIGAVQDGPDAGDLTLDARADLDNATLHAPHAAPGPESDALTDVRGTIGITLNSVEANGITAALGSTRLTADFSVGFGNSTANEQATGDQTPLAGIERLGVAIDATDLHLVKPVEDFAKPLAPAAAKTLAELRQRFRPAGIASGSLTVRSTDAGDIETRTSIRALARGSFDAVGGRVGVENTAGTISVTQDLATFEGFSGDVSFDNTPAGRATLNGDYAIAPEQSPPAKLDLDPSGVRLESGLVRGLIDLASPAASEWLASNQAAGVIDGRVIYATDDSAAVDVRVNASPRSLSIVRASVPVRFDEVTGTATFSADGGDIDLAGAGSGLDARFRGAWFPPTDTRPQPGLEGDFSLNARSLSTELRALMPQAALDAIDAIELTSDAPLALRNAHIALNRPPHTVAAPTGSIATSFSGDLITESAAVNPGVVFDRIDAVASIRIDSPGLPPRGRPGQQRDDAPENPTPPPVSWSVALTGKNAALIGRVPLENIRVRVENAEPPGAVVVPVFVADTMGGRIAAEIAVFPPDPTDLDAPPAASNATRYRVQAVADAISLGRLFEEGLAPRDQDAPPGPAKQRGVLAASLGLEGYTAHPETRRGRILLRAQPRDTDADTAQATELVALPGVLEITKLTNLRRPTSSPINFAYADAFIKGGRALVRDLSLESYGDHSAAVIGSGWVSIDDLTADLRFTTAYTPRGRGLFGIGAGSLVNEIVDIIRNEVATARVTGTLTDPQVNIRTFPATQSLLGAIIHGDATPEVPVPISPFRRDP